MTDLCLHSTTIVFTIALKFSRVNTESCVDLWQLLGNHVDVLTYTVLLLWCIILKVKIEAQSVLTKFAETPRVVATLKQTHLRMMLRNWTLFFVTDHLIYFYR